MKYRSVGKSGLKISEVALGSWVTDLKGTAAENVTKETVKLAYDSGVNFFGCADAYSGGAAERFLGEVLKQYPRKELVISSKVYFPTGEGVNDRGLSRKHIFESIDQTLKNMQTDYLDMYFCHRKLGIGITTFSPLAQGLLTGKYRKGQPLPAGSRVTWADESETSSNGSDC